MLERSSTSLPHTPIIARTEGLGQGAMCWPSACLASRIGPTGPQDSPWSGQGVGCAIP
jgi:hypothetical protein